jgi:DUF1680 family protein
MPNSIRRLNPVSFTQVTLEDSFWAPRQELNRTVTLPHIYRECEAAGRISAFDLNFQRPVPSPITLIFGDSDPAKWLEAASCAIAARRDPALEKMVDGLADKIIRAQQPDGYLNTHFTVVQPEMRWRNLRDWHEMYCAGHLIEGAVAHHQATGSRKLLDALSRYADHIDAEFGSEPGKKRGYCGHPEIELALVRLYHATNEPRYLNLASHLIDERGAQPNYFTIEARERGEDPAAFWAKTYEYCQAQVPVREQTKIAGHAVRAMYLLCAMADLAHEKDDPTLRSACDRLWDNLIAKRMYLTGAIGPSRHNEGFTDDYDLPDETAYGETCATIGLILWAGRMLQFEGDGRYADVIERGMYNGFLSGISLGGDRFFYENPLASAGGHHRQSWFECPCCPPNVARVLAGLGGYFYSTGPKDIWVHLFARGKADLKVGGRDVILRQTTKYPWEGEVKIEIETAAPQTIALHLRQPGWCPHATLLVNGTPPAEPVSRQAGYLTVEREWRRGDSVEYRMEMPVQHVWAHPAVRHLQGRMALQRGPLVYCLEGADHGGIGLDRISINPAQDGSGKFSIEYQDRLLGGVNVLRGNGRAIDDEGWEGLLYRLDKPCSKPMDITAVPYYAWDNRAPGEMRIWIRAFSG